MKSNLLKEIWNSGSAVINGWLSIPNSFTAENMAHIGWDSLTIDLQHGLNDYSASIAMLQAISNTNTVPLARVPWNEPGIIMKMLDLGAYGIIAPMINTKEECEKFVSYCLYPPLGQRSYGPARANIIGDNNYCKHANKEIIKFAMIETKTAVKNLDEILSVKHLDGIYIGPADMSLSYGLGPKFDVEEDPVYSNIKKIVEKTRKYNKIAGIHNGTTAYAKKMIDLGFKFVTISSDLRSMKKNAEEIIQEMKLVSLKNKKISY